jgi:hypothetical protein
VFFVVLQLAIEWGYAVLFELTTGGRSREGVARAARAADGGEPGPASLMRNLLRVVTRCP